MKRAPIFPKDENGRTNDDEFEYDPHCDFTKIMEEARKHADDPKHQLGRHENLTKAGGGGGEERDQKRKKKSWKSSLLFWRKDSKKQTTESYEKRPKNSSKCAPLRSGPLPKSRSAVANHRFSRPTSGPVSGWFSPSRAEEAQLPYMCLQQQESRTSNGNTFGPIYRVT